MDKRCKQADFSCSPLRLLCSGFKMNKCAIIVFSIAVYHYFMYVLAVVVVAAVINCDDHLNAGVNVDIKTMRLIIRSFAVFFCVF